MSSLNPYESAHATCNAGKRGGGGEARSAFSKTFGTGGSREYTLERLLEVRQDDLDLHATNRATMTRGIHCVPCRHHTNANAPHPTTAACTAYPPPTASHAGSRTPPTAARASPEAAPRGTAALRRAAAPVPCAARVIDHLPITRRTAPAIGLASSWRTSVNS